MTSCWLPRRRPMADPYTAVGLIPTVRGVRKRAEIQRNLEHLSHLIAAASWLSSLDLPVRLVLLPEGALQGFTDEVFDLDHATYANECAIDVPGPETDHLGQLARHWHVFIMGQAKARHPAFPDRFFNVGFAIDPSGEVILKHHKLSTLYPVEHSMTPHDVWDRWIELYGRTLEAFFPVADTEIGRLGVLMANEGSYPENARGLAMNGAEIVYRASYPHPHTGNEFFEIQSRARALDNNFYVVAPNLATYYLTLDSDTPIDTFGGRSLIVDYKGRIVGQHLYGAGSSYVAGTIDVDALRHHRTHAQWDNWMKDLRTEIFQLVYQDPIYPKNLYLDRAPSTLAEFLKELDPDLTIEIHEVLSDAAQESSNAWNNAGTGHAALCELNYTPENADGTVSAAKAVSINEQFQISRQYWAYLVSIGALPEAHNFINSTPHMTFVKGKANIEYLRKRV